MTQISARDPDGLTRQGPSLIGRRRLHAPLGGPPLHRHDWPPVIPHSADSAELPAFVHASGPEQQRHLVPLRATPDQHSKVLHGYLATLHADCFGYPDSPFTTLAYDEIELARHGGRLRLEQEPLEHWLGTDPLPRPDGQDAIADHLDELTAHNPGVGHPPFEFLRDRATRTQMERFLQCDLIRNMVVDGEVALVVVGLQGMQKAVAAANLWDLAVGRYIHDLAVADGTATPVPDFFGTAEQWQNA